MSYHYIFIAFVFITMVSFLCMGKSTKKNKSHKRNTKRKHKRNTKRKSMYDINPDDLFDLGIIPKPIKKDYDKYNVIGKVYLKYINQIDGEDQYLTWRFGGNDPKDKTIYNLILLSYKNKQNEFKIHLDDYLYLKPFYEKYGLYNITMRDQLKQIVFATSDYNIHKEQYLELIKTVEDTNVYMIKASLWSNKGPYSHLHIDNKNKLYFDKGICQNVAKFMIN